MLRLTAFYPWIQDEFTKFLVISSHVMIGPPCSAQNPLVGSQKKNLSPPSCRFLGLNVVYHVYCVIISFTFKLLHCFM
jgi:hypothetical protein